MIDINKNPHDEPIYSLDIVVNNDGNLLLEVKKIISFKDGRVGEYDVNKDEFEIVKNSLFFTYEYYLKIFPNEYLELEGKIYKSKYIAHIENVFKSEQEECFGEPFIDKSSNDNFNNKAMFLIKIKYKTDKEEEVNLIKEVLEDFIIDFEKFKGGKNQLEKEIRAVLLKNKIEKDLNINSKNKIKRKI